MPDSIEAMLTGGHPNSLGNTEQVVQLVLDDNSRLEELFDCYKSGDEVVRLRTSSAMKRVDAGNHALLLSYLDRFLTEIAELDQASAQWTLAQLFDSYQMDMNKQQWVDAVAIVKRNLAHHTDWIVLNISMDKLVKWSEHQPDLMSWLKPHLKRLSQDRRKSVAARAARYFKQISA